MHSHNFSTSFNKDPKDPCEPKRTLGKCLPRDQLADWDCLIQHESKFKTGAVGKNKNGSKDHGIFQINDGFWCVEGKPGGDCNIDCASKLFNFPVKF